MEAISDGSEPSPAVEKASYGIQFDPSGALIREATTNTIQSNLRNNLLRVAKCTLDILQVSRRSYSLDRSRGSNGSIVYGVWSRSSFPGSTANDSPAARKTLTDLLLDQSAAAHLLAPSQIHKSLNRTSMDRRLGSRRAVFAWQMLCYLLVGFRTQAATIRLLDASDGRIRASYPIVDHRERMVAPHSMIFSDDGTTLFAGYDSAIEIFDVSRPGEAGERYRTIVSRKSKDGQKVDILDVSNILRAGIISSLNLDPSRQGLLAAGSYSGQIALHDTKSSEIAPALVFNTTETTGVTQLKFHPHNDQVMFSVSRKSHQILCWDLRYGGTTFHSFYRPGRTNQKINFDIDWAGVNLISGATVSGYAPQDGKIRFYSLADLNQPAQEFQIHSDTIGSASFNPTASTTIVTCAGSRRRAIIPSPSLSSRNTPPVQPLPLRDSPCPSLDYKLTELKLWTFSYL
ncbi:hypothetical protein VP01_1266g5 [Puccinia sorghi]|uniref:DUF2415 domain-containing protein n=1 Tax=Puccinia sorghi TaxID=27349 RepID=A0A0L6VQK0_9BASI|nr:hypothetical protein VP01_1266g5 [Puccinia sorghi]